MRHTKQPPGLAWCRNGCIEGMCPSGQCNTTAVFTYDIRAARWYICTIYIIPGYVYILYYVRAITASLFPFVDD